MKFMKFILGSIITTIMMSTTIFAADGKLINGRTMIPLRGAFEELGFEVSWDNSTNSAMLKDSLHTIIVKNGDKNFTVDGVKYTSDVAPKMVDGSIYIPLRSIGDRIGATTYWDNVNEFASISYNSYVSYISLTDESKKAIDNYRTIKIIDSVSEGFKVFNESQVTTIQNLLVDSKSYIPILESLKDNYKNIDSFDFTPISDELETTMNLICINAINSCNELIKSVNAYNEGEYNKSSEYSKNSERYLEESFEAVETLDSIRISYLDTISDTYESDKKFTEFKESVSNLIDENKVFTKSTAIEPTINEQLYNAVTNNDVSRAKKLLDSGANPDYKILSQTNNLVPILIATQSIEMTRLLLDYGADVNTPYYTSYTEANGTSKSGIWYPVFEMILLKDVDSVEAYISHDVDLTVLNFLNMTPYDYVVYEFNKSNNNSELLKILNLTKTSLKVEDKTISEELDYTQATNSEVINYSSTDQFSNEAELLKYLEDNYSVVHTTLGDIKLNFEVFRNTSSILVYDYSIQAEADILEGIRFRELETSIEYSQADKEATKQELKNHMYNLAIDIVSKMPNKKITGCYDESFYVYKSIREDYRVYQYYKWVNYAPTTVLTDYYDTSVTTFKWME